MRPTIAAMAYSRVAGAALARAVGVAQAAMEHAIAYANDRVQFGQKLIEFPRVADKIAIRRCRLCPRQYLSLYPHRGERAMPTASPGLCNYGTGQWRCFASPANATTAAADTRCCVATPNT